MKSRVLIFAALLIAGCAATGEIVQKHDEFTKHYEESRFEITKNGSFSLEMVVKEHELKTGVNKVDLIVHDKNDRDVIGADITMTPWMPEMGHGVFDAPVVTEKGGGLYTFENIILIMSGHWELRINIKKNGMQDSAVFDFPDVKIDRGHEHKIIKAPAPSAVDLSTAKLSDNKTFNISYRSKLHPVPINKMHVWTLTVKTADGKPVENAVISVDGDMPEHGHGLPTQPEVTEYLGAGKYLLEGIKFSMPGLWVINLSINSQGKKDSVSFNLFLKE